MLRTVAFSLALAAFGSPLLSHVIQPTSLALTVGEQKSFVVSDSSGCSARLRAQVQDSSVASVSPDQEVTAVDQTFTVTGRTAGKTPITITWNAVAPCVDTGTGRVDVTVTTAPPNVVVTSLPGGLVQETNQEGSTGEFTVANIGGSATTVFVNPSTDFFDVAPRSADLAPGASRSFTIAAVPLPAGFYEGFVGVTGTGVGPGTNVRVRLVSANRPSTPPLPRPAANRVDLSTRVGQFQKGSIRITNHDTGTVRGVFSADVPWILPPGEAFELVAGFVDVPFEVDLDRRPLHTAAVGTLSLHYLLSPGEIASSGPVAGHGATGASSTTVTVVSTVTPPSSPADLPPLGAQEIALFAPGVGRILGSVGLFISDLTLSALDRNADTRNVRLYYSPLGAETRTVNIDPVSRTIASPLGDLVKGVFGGDSQIGSLQIRSPDVLDLGVLASIFNSSDPAGTFGTAIPIFRSDRSVLPGQQLFLTGLRKTATSHTNLFVQETSGNSARVRIRLLTGSGSPADERVVDLAAFGVTQITDNPTPLPDGMVSAVLEHDEGSDGAFVGYATPVDRASGDFWAVADWSLQYGYSVADPLLIPVAGAIPGANNTDFRTDVSFMNSGTVPAAGTLRYRSADAGVLEETIDVAPGATVTYEDLTRSIFGIEGTTLGYLTWTPASGAMRITSRNYTLVAETGATFGTAVPVLPLSAAISRGELIRFGGVDDASLTTVTDRRPATFRSNVGIIETSGQPIRVRATMNYTVPSSLVTTIGSASVELELAPFELRRLNRVTQEILGAFRGALGDLRNVQLDFEVIEGDGSAVIFLSSIDNGTGDSLLRVE
ncbi:MAG TPA: hypothetical protein VMS56_08595 [Thermoanaerobaculia bacterium]|nr:hypothetical protein [Thermoanaerobaculia bacterium]